jgi:hypothetical protein
MKVIFGISAHDPASLVQSGSPFRIAFVAFAEANSLGSK